MSGYAGRQPTLPPPLASHAAQLPILPMPPPKSAPQRRAAKPQPKVQRKAPKEELTSESGKLQALKRCAAVQCTSCSQWTRSCDSDILPKKSQLKWHKFNRAKNGNLVVSGSECYFCFVTRRRFSQSADELNDARSKSADLDVRWL